MNSHSLPSRLASHHLASGLSLTLLIGIILSTAACTGTILDSEEEDKVVLASESRWAIPPEILDLGDQQFVSYTGAGAWHGSSGCAGGLTPGAVELKSFVESNFPQVSSIGGYNCRAIVGNSSKMSVHATGRALDIMIPLVSGATNNEIGDPIGNWLIAHAEEIGIQYIIWDRTQWTASRSAGTKARRYNGANPHHDHLHVELSVAASHKDTPWFSGNQDAPDLPECESIPAAGGTLDNSSLCLHLHGASKYWRSVDGQGNEGDLLWTNAFRSAEPANWASYTLDVEEAGRYQVQVFLDPEFARFAQTKYRIQHAGTSTSLLFDQSTGDGWTSLGDFDFESSSSQSLTIYDNADTSPGSDRSIMVDAVRLVPVP